jgi:hypothetical protein
MTMQILCPGHYLPPFPPLSLRFVVFILLLFYSLRSSDSEPKRRKKSQAGVTDDGESQAGVTDDGDSQAGVTDDGKLQAVVTDDGKSHAGVMDGNSRAGVAKGKSQTGVAGGKLGVARGKDSPKKGKTQTTAKEEQQDQ